MLRRNRAFSLATAATPEKQRETPSPPPLPKKRKVMVVDDDPPDEPLPPRNRTPQFTLDPYIVYAPPSFDRRERKKAASLPNPTPQLRKGGGGARETGEQRITQFFSRTSSQTLSQEASVLSTNGTSPLKGFTNIGNSCYINAVLASLIRLPQFVDAVLSTAKMYRLAGSPPPNKTLLTTLADIVGESATCGSGLSATALKASLDHSSTVFRGNAHQDAHEFLVTLLALLNDEIMAMLCKTPHAAKGDVPDGQCVDTSDDDDESPPHTSPSLVRRLFEGELVRQFSCKSCGSAASVAESFTVLSLPLPQQLDIDVTGTPTLSISDLMRTALRGSEDIHRDCTSCGCSEASASDVLSSIPHILILHVKRFRLETVAKGVRCVKRTDPVKAPLELSIADLVASDTHLPPNDALSFDSESGASRYNRPLVPGGLFPSFSYRLRAAVLHIGKSVQCGHYVCDYRDADGVWWHLNDSTVNKVRCGDEVVNRRDRMMNGYLYVYEWADET